MRNNSPPKLRQARERGIASVLFMLLTGLSLSAIVFSAIYYLRGSQAQALTVHAQTQAQLKAWSAAEALRQYLYQIGASAAASLQVNQVVTLTGISGVSATVSSVTAADTTSCSGGTRVGLSVVGSSGGANALLNLVYCAIGSGSSGSSASTSATINIKGGLDLSGDLKVIGDDKARVVVDGAVTGSGSLSGIDNLYASGDVTLGGSTSINTLFSEGNISLSGSGSYTTVSSMKNITLTGGVVASITAIGNVTTGAAKVGSIKTQSSVSASNTAVSGSALAQLNYTEASAGSVASGQYGGTLSKPSWNSSVVMSKVSGLTVSITALTATTISSPSIDAYAYKSAANYQFDVDSSGRIVVTVANVNSISDGTYYLVGSNGNQDYLCTSTSYAASTCKAKICAGYSDYNSCFSYSSGTWSYNGSTMAPGVIWFKGNLVAGTGTYYNSVIATGDISTSGSNVTYAVNYAGYTNICNNSRFPTLYPTNYCAAGSATLTVNATGNIAFAAGGYVGSTYVGGLIDLTAANHVYGDVLAGDIVKTGGSTTIHGEVVASRLGSHSGTSAFAASTKIDLSNLPSTFVPGNNPTNTSTAASAKLLWSRYQ